MSYLTEYSLGLRTDVRLRDAQRAGLKFIIDRFTSGYRGLMLAHEMGFGKTVTALVSLLWVRKLYVTGKKPFSSLVVCPRKVQQNWISEVARFFPNEGIVIGVLKGAGVTHASATELSTRSVYHVLVMTFPPRQ